MNITCNACQSQLQLDDSRVPAGSFRVKCSRCGNLISVSRGNASPRESVSEPPSSSAEPPSSPPAKLDASSEWERFQPVMEDLVENRMNSLRTEILSTLSPHLKSDLTHPERRVSKESSDTRALICESDQAVSSALAAMARELGHRVDTARNVSDAVRKLDASIFHLVITSSSFPDDNNGGGVILNKINSQKPDIRRDVFAVLIGKEIRTTDASRAFFSGANILVNLKDMNQLRNLIAAGKKYYEKLYHHYFDVLATSVNHL